MYSFTSRSTACCETGRTFISRFSIFGSLQPLAGFTRISRSDTACSRQAVIQQSMDAVDRPDAQALILQFDVLVPLHPTVLLEIVVDLLDLDRGELVQLDIP